MRVRSAVRADEDLVLAWANDAAARAASFQTESISRETHHRWFAERMADPHSSRIWIGLDGKRPIGVVRVDPADDGVHVVSITLDPAVRGRGRSRPLLEAGLEAARAAVSASRFRAWIRDENRASIALFTGAGFEPPPREPADMPPGWIVLERD